MSTIALVEYDDASPEVKAVYDDIMATRKVAAVNNFWKALAVHPPTLARTWESVREVMAPGALDPLVKELIYIAVSATNGCEYCIRSHTAAARAKGMDDDMLGELLAVIGMANETNRLVTTLQVPVDAAFLPSPPKPKKTKGKAAKAEPAKKLPGKKAKAEKKARARR